MSERKTDIPRRRFLGQTAAAAGGAALLGTGLAGPARANRVPHPHEDSMTYLDQKTYTSNVEVHAQFTGQHGGKMQMVAKGKRRFMFSRGDVWEVTDALKPTMIKKRAFRGGQVQLAYNNKIKKWILMTGGSPPPTHTYPDAPRGKYSDPHLLDDARYAPGLRGVRFYDVTDPTNLKLISQWSCDQGDPDRVIQTGAGTHRCYYDGGKYAYLDTAPDNSFIHMESPVRGYSNCMQIIDVEDPMNPKFVSNWWFPGQRAGEERAYRKWREYGDEQSFTSSHGPFYVPKRVEDGGKYAYGAYGSFGVTIHDVSDPANPKLVGRWRPPYLPGAIPFHTTDPSMLDRGFVIGSAETLYPDCFEPFHENYVIDIRDPANPKKISSFGRWVPPAEAPYDDFCNKRGRYGTHNPAHYKAPGKRHPSFTPYAAFNAGLQIMDFADPANPTNIGHFIPPSSGSLDNYLSYFRPGESVFVEWDRNLIWFGSDSGVYLVTHKALGEPNFKPTAVTEWTLPHLNAGHDA